MHPAVENKLCLLGDIVSIYESEGIQYAKIHYEPGFVDVVLKDIQDVFLNDRVQIDAFIEVKDISQQEPLKK